MTSHVMRRALIGATALRGVRAEAGLSELIAEITKNVNASTAEAKVRFETLERTNAAFRVENDARLADIAKGKADVVVAEKVDRAVAAIDKNEAEVKKILATIETNNKELDKLNSLVSALRVGGTTEGNPDPRMANPHAAEYCKAFSEYFRKGDRAAGGEHALRELEVKAAMTVNSDPDGGFTVIPEMESQIDAVLKQVSPMRSIATIRPVGTNSYKKLVNLHGTASGWVGELDSRPTTLGSQLSELLFPIMEMYAMPAASQTLLDDSFIDIGSWLASEVELEFAQKEGIAFVSGDGVKKPQGILGYTNVADASYAWGSVGFIGTGASGAFGGSSADNLIDLYHALKTPYRANGTFTLNNKTLGACRKLKDGQGNYLVNNTFKVDGMITEMLGRPVVEMVDMPDMAANSYSIAFGDFKRGYLIVDRVGIRVLRDPFTSKPYVLFYTTKRVGGGIMNFEAIKLLKFI